MNDRLTKFMSLAKMLEDAVDRALKSSKEASTVVPSLLLIALSLKRSLQNRRSVTAGRNQ